MDFLFPEHRLIVETDGWRYHRTRQAFERDRTRDLAHMAAGYRTLRVTDRALKSDPARLARTLATVLRG